MPLPAQGSFKQVTHEFTVRQSPWLPPDELEAYHRIDPDFARGIISTVQSAQQARIDAELIPIRAEALALKIATIGVTFFPWVAAGIAVIFALNGLDTAALITGIFSGTTGGVQIIQAVRRPPRAPSPAPQPAAPKPKPSQVSPKPKAVAANAKTAAKRKARKKKRR